MKYPLFAFLLLLLVAPTSVSASAPEEVLTQFKGIKQVLEQADKVYYQEHHSMMSDEAYDYLRSYHDQLLDEFPELETYEAPLFVDGRKQKVPHRKPVLSLKKAYSDEEILKFCSKIGSEERFLVEPKIDGASIIIEYLNRRLVKAVTRGNSLQGVDVTTVLLASGSLPLVLEKAPKQLQLRGEAYISKDDFVRLNQLRQNTGKDPFSSARNTASGTLMLKDFVEVRSRGLRVLIFEVRNGLELGIESHSDALEMVGKWGLPVVDFNSSSSPQRLLAILENENQNRLELPYDIDGFVIKVDDLNLRNQLGSTQKYPRWAIARKYRSEPVVTKVLAIEYSISDKGRKTPVAILSPIKIGGATIQRASLHSDAIVEAMGIQAGSKVKVIRAGGVIPEIVGLAND